MVTMAAQATYCLVPPGSTCLQQVEVPLGARKAKRRERRAEPSKQHSTTSIAAQATGHDSVH